MADCGVALCGEGHDDPACSCAVHLADHEVHLADSLAKAPWIALPVIPIQSHWNGQQLQNV